MPNLNLNVNRTESLASLQARRDEGYSVVRAGHVGNLRLYNLAIANAGIPLQLVDHTITGTDKNNVPEAIMRGGKQTTIAEPDQLVFRGIGRLENGQEVALDTFHIASLQTAFPDTPIIQNTEYLRQQAPLVGELVTIALREMPELFRRVVETDGTVATDPNEAARLVERQGILQLQDDPRTERGVLIPNDVDILANFVIDAIVSTRAVQYHISGKDMAKYMTLPKSKADHRTPLAIVQRLYGALQTEASFRSELPPELTVELVTGSSVRFATTADRHAELDTMLAAIKDTDQKFRAENDRRGAFFRSPAGKEDGARQAFTTEAMDRQNAITAELKTATEPFPDLFDSPNGTPFTSQRDVSDAGGLYVPEEVQAASMSELDGVWKRLTRYLERAR